jgi:hypothetical protein
MPVQSGVEDVAVEIDMLYLETVFEQLSADQIVQLIPNITKLIAVYNESEQALLSVKAA